MSFGFSKIRYYHFYFHGITQWFYLRIDGLIQERRNSIANALELRLLDHPIDMQSIFTNDFRQNRCEINVGTRTPISYDTCLFVARIMLSLSSLIRRLYLTQTEAGFNILYVCLGRIYRNQIWIRECTKLLRRRIHWIRNGEHWRA